MRNHLTLALVLGLLLIRSSIDAATSVTLQQGVSPTAGYAGTIDAFVTNGTLNNADPAKNYGAAGALAVAASGLSQGEFQSLLRFDLSLAKSQFDSTYGVGGWAVSNVALSLMPQTANNAIFNAVHSGNFGINWLSSDTWTEGTGTPAAGTTDGITYNGIAALISSGSQSVGSFSYDGTTGTIKTYTFSSIGSGLRNDISLGSQATFDLFAADSQVSAVFNSRSFATTTNRPALTITANAVPEPGRAILFGMALFSIGLRRSRKAR